MSGTVNVTVMAGSGLILDVSRVDGNTTSFLFRRLVDLVVVGELGTTLGRQNFGDGSGKGSLTVVDVAWTLS